MVFHGLYIICGYSLYFGGGSYPSVCVPPPIGMFHSPCSVYPCGIYLFSVHFILCLSISLYTYTPSFTFCQLCDIYPQMNEKVWGCMHKCFIICSQMCILKYVYMIYITIYHIISQDSNGKHVSCR